LTRVWIGTPGAATRLDRRTIMINSAMTVSEIAVEVPQSTRLFEKLKIDYCCGGNRPLTEACASVGVDVAKIIEMLEVNQTNLPADGAMDFQRLSLPELISHIVSKHHVFTKEEMIRLASLMKKVVAAHGDNHPELHKVGELLGHLC